MENLAHNASFDSEDKDAPSKSGIKHLVPFVFVFSPSLLLVTRDFTWPNFLLAFFGCVLGITALGAALSRHLLVRTRPWENLLLVLAAFLLVAPELYSTLLGVALIVPVVLRHWAARHTKEALPA
jgi:TRAP-type uncharacterized transport system fused permease subunit